MKKNRLTSGRASSSNGFTLIELIVVLGATLIIFAVSWSILSNMRGEANNTSACNELASIINKTRNYALNGKSVDGEVPSAFSVHISGSNVDINPTDESYTLSKGVSCGSATITYSVPDGTCGGSCPVELVCGSGSEHKVVVDKFKAVCN